MENSQGTSDGSSVTRLPPLPLGAAQNPHSMLTATYRAATIGSGTTRDLFQHSVRGKFSCLVGLALLAGVAGAQPAIRLKGFKPGSRTLSSPVATKTRNPGRSHFLVQFATEPGPPQMQALADRGATVLSYVPDAGLSIAMPDATSLSGLGIQWLGQLLPSEKLSPALDGALGSGQAPPVLVEFYADVPGGEERAIAME